MFLKFIGPSVLIWIIIGLRTVYSLSDKYEVGHAKGLALSSIIEEYGKDIGKLSSMITFINSSSSSIHSILFRMNGCAIGEVDRRSYVLSTNCIIEIVKRNCCCVFICEGGITVERMTIDNKYPIQRIFESGLRGDILSLQSALSSVMMKSSVFGDIVVCESGNGFICGKDIRKEEVIGCLFENVSVVEDRENKEIRGIRREECIIRDCFIIGGENGIYGDIVSGINENIGDGYVFESNNNTFVECHRRRLLHYRDVWMNEDYSNENYTTRIVLSTTSSHTITNCTFTNCSSSSSSGGALYFSSYYRTYTITITNCTFSNCSANGYGGAVSCTNASSCIVNRCSFDKCTGGGGGGIYMKSISSCANVKDSTFSLCSSDYGGGLVLYLCNVTDCEGGVDYGIVSGSRFSECNATKSSEYGGGINPCDISSSTIRSCYFYKCYSSGYGGAIGWQNLTSEQIPLSIWIYDCVFELNSAKTSGHDVYINSSRSRTTSIFDNLSYTLTDQTNRVMWYRTNHDSWLPYGRPFDGTIYVRASITSSSKSCGVISDACGSLNGAIESSYYEESEFNCVKLMEGMHNHDTSTIEVGENTLPITSGNGEVEFDVTSSFSSEMNVFEISNGTLNMSGFKIMLQRNVV